MSKVIKKNFWEWQFDKEEDWLNEMAEQGLVLKNVIGTKYTFENCQPSEYKIKLEYINKNTFSKKTQDYISFVKDTGAERIDSHGKWVYFRKKVEDGDFELYSDNKEIIKQITKNQLYWIGALIIWSFLVYQTVVRYILEPNSTWRLFYLGLCLVFVIYEITTIVSYQLVKNKMKTRDNLFE